MPGKTMLGVTIAALVALLVLSATFVVRQWEVALKLQLGEIVDSDYKPGLHLKWPLVNNVIKFDSRIQSLDARPERFLTVEKKYVIVDSFAKWRISDVAQYYRSTGGNPNTTSRLLSERINTALRDEFGKRTVQEVVAGERSQIMDLMAKSADRQAGDLGVEIVDVRIKTINFPPEVSDSVFTRMRSERERVARELRAQGAEAAEKIRADAERQRTEILAEAYRVSEELRGQGDAEATRIYADAFQTDAEFYAFWRSLTAYRKVFEGGKDMLVLEPDSDFFRYFGNQRGQ